MKRALVSTSQLLRRANLPLRNLSTAAVSVNALKPGKECLLDIPHTNITLLNNGFKVASEDIGTPTCTVGIWIQSGSKYETADNNGISNLLEHVIFKGTNKRSAAEFEKAIVKLGAQLGVHTGREHTAIYARCLSRNADKVVELLADAVMNLNVKDEDVERQKPAILAQMKAEEGDQHSNVMNILHKAAFQGTPLARSVFGPIDVLMELKAKDVQEFVEDNFKGPRMALVAAGGVPHGLMEELGNKYFGNASTHYSRLFPVDPEKPCRYTGSEMMFDDYSLPMTYGAIAVEGVGWNHPDRIPLQIATAMTGSWSSAEGFGPYSAHHVAQNVGWTMGHEGPCHNFHAFNHSYKNDGLFGVYHETSEDAAQAVLFNILKYWKHMCTKCQDDEVLMGKNLLKSHLAKSMETTHAVANDIGRQTLDFTNRKSLHELFSEIDAVTTDRLHEACMNNIWDRDPVSAAIGRVNAHHYMNYMQIRSQMSWWRY